MPEERPTAPCTVLQTLITAGAPFAGVQKGVPYQAVKVYILALVLKEMGGTDYSANLCPLLDSLKSCASLPDYQLRQAYLAALSEGLEEGSAEGFQSALAGCCCEADMPQLLAAEAFLFYELTARERQ
jgi:hypothetical protein